MSEVKAYPSAGFSDAEIDEPCPACGDPLPGGQQLWHIADGEAIDPKAEEWAYCSPQCARAAADRVAESLEEGWYTTPPRGLLRHCRWPDLDDPARRV